MAKESRGYLSWWARENRWSRLLISGPILVIAGPIGIGISIAESDTTILMYAVLALLTGMFIMLYGVADYVGKPLPLWVAVTIAAGLLVACVVIRTR